MIDVPRERSTYIENGKDPEMTLAGALAVLRRRWWLLVLVPLLAGVAAWLYGNSRPRTYTSEALLQKAGSDRVLATWTSPMASAAEPIRAQIEIIQSRAVLGPVVDSTGFRLAIARSELSPWAVFADARIESAASGGRYRIARSDAGFRLEDLAAERVIDSSPDGTFEGNGFALRVAPGLPSSYFPLDFRILHRQSAIRSLRGRVDLDRIPDTDLISVSFTDEDPEYAASVVTAVTNSYQRHSADVAQQETSRRREFLRRQVAAAADSLQAAQRLMLAYQTSSGAVAPELEGNSRMTLLMNEEEDLRDLRYDEATLRALNEALARGDASDEVLRRAVVLQGGLIPTAEALYNRLQELQTERARLTASRFGMTAEGSQVQVIDSLIANGRAELREIAQHSLAGVRQRRAEAEARIEELRAAVSTVPARSGEVARLQQNVDGIERRYDLLLSKYYEAQIAEAVETGDIDIIDPAVVPVSPDPSQTGRTVFLAVVLGLILSVGGAFLLEYTTRRVRGREQAEQETGARVLATIPRFAAHSNGGAARPVVAMSARNATTEAFRSLRTMLRFSTVDGMSTIAVSSAEPGEGKSVVAANLAVTLAADATRVLLIDADFPRPVQHETFGVRRSPGLSDVLAGEATAEQAIRFDERNDVHVLPAGRPDPYSAELLAGREFRALIAELAKTYEVIVIDTPPVLAVADTIAVARVAESMILVVRDNATDRRALRRAASQLRGVGGSITGLVLNDVTDASVYDSYYDNGRATHERNGTSAGGRLRNLLRAAR